MKMHGLSAVLLGTGLFALALGGCDKHPGQGKPQPAAATRAQSPMKPVKVMEEKPHHTATAEGGQCAGGMAEGKSCEGGCDQWDQAAAEVAKRPVPADAEWKTIPVSGMTCGGCERRIIASLGKVEGVLAVEADAELGQVRIATTRGADLREVAVETINQLGYSAQ
jgi:copper chaperone CopZ